jgi:hypothetical protein
MKMEENKTKCEKKVKVAFYVFKMCKTHAHVARYNFKKSLHWTLNHNVVPQP